jgi:hypothetical protein
MMTLAGGAGSAGALSKEQLRQPFLNLVADGHRRVKEIDAALDLIDRRYRGRSEERSYRQFLIALRLANQAARKVLTDSERRFEVTPEASFDKVRTLMKRLASEHEKQVEALRSTRAEALEIFSQPFTRLVKKLLPNAEVLFFGWKLERYEIRVYDAKSAGQFDGGAEAYTSREFGDDFRFLQFFHPVLRQSDLFQHPVFGHELAHPAIRQPAPEEVVEVLETATPAPDYAAVAADFAHRQVTKEGVVHDKEDRQRLEDWFMEIACDIVGMRLFGPAFALAFTEVTSVNMDLERKSGGKDHYPPTRMRLDYQRQEIERFSFPDPWEEWLPKVLSQAIASKPPVNDPDLEIASASKWMEVAVEVFRSHCVPRLVKDQPLEPAELSARYAEISALIAAGIPPAERLLVAEPPMPASPNVLAQWSEEYDWRLILNVARLGLLDPENDEGLGRASTCRLATGAIEMAEFQRRARKLREQYRLVGDLGAP